MIPVTCDPEGKLDRVSLDEIEEFQGGLKSLGKTEYSKLKQSITEKGFVVPCFAWRNGSGKWKLLDGHQRVRVIRTEGWTIDGGIPVVEIVADNERDAKEKLLAIVSRYGRVEGQGLYEFLDGTGIDLEEWTVPDLPDLDLDSWLDEFIRDPEVPPGDPEAVPEVPEEATTQPGDLWVLGDHRVLCGDATSVDDVENLMGGETFDMLFTSPPYNVDVQYLSHDDTHKSSDQYLGFLSSVCSAWIGEMKSGRAFVWNIGVSARTYPHKHLSMLENHGLDFVRQYVWQKVGVPVPAWYHTAQKQQSRYLTSKYTHEMVYVLSTGELEAGEHTSFDQTLENDVFQINQTMATRDLPSGPTRSGAGADINLSRRAYKAHPAAFPVSLPSSFIQHYTSESESVVDPFLGSGTTLIAAEKQGRRCFGLEIEPKYVDVIVKRWEDYTGKAAVLEQSKAA